LRRSPVCTPVCTPQAVPRAGCDAVLCDRGIKSLASSDTTSVVRPGSGHGRKKHSWHDDNGGEDTVV